MAGPTRLPDGSLALLLIAPFVLPMRPDPRNFTTPFGGPPGPYQCGPACEPNAFAPGIQFWGFALMSINPALLARGYGAKEWIAIFKERK